jgi:hypothetical protein
LAKAGVASANAPTDTRVRIVLRITISSSDSKYPPQPKTPFC